MGSTEESGFRVGWGDGVSERINGRSPSRIAYQGRRLNPRYVRSRVFTKVPLGRRGLDPADVYPFLRWVADDLERRTLTEASLRAENDRLRAALREPLPQQA